MTLLSFEDNSGTNVCFKL